MKYLIICIIFLFVCIVVPPSSSYSDIPKSYDNIPILFQKDMKLQGYPIKNGSSKFVTLKDLTYGLERGSWLSSKRKIKLALSGNILKLISKSGKDNIYTYYFEKTEKKGKTFLILFKITEKASKDEKQKVFMPKDSRFMGIINDVFGRSAKYSNENNVKLSNKDTNVKKNNKPKKSNVKNANSKDGNFSIKSILKILHYATWGMGIIGAFMTFYFPKSDKRTKTGYKGNENAWGCGIRFVGLVLMGLAFAILKWGYGSF